MKFSKDFLKEFDGTVEDKIIDNSRWSIIHKRIFKFEEKFYQTIYSVGATESQDELPYEYDAEEIECLEVVPVKKTIIVYKEKK